MARLQSHQLSYTIFRYLRWKISTDELQSFQIYPYDVVIALLLNQTQTCEYTFHSTTSLNRQINSFHVNVNVNWSVGLRKNRLWLLALELTIITQNWCFSCCSHASLDEPFNASTIFLSLFGILKIFLMIPGEENRNFERKQSRDENNTFYDLKLRL